MNLGWEVIVKRIVSKLILTLFLGFAVLITFDVSSGQAETNLSGEWTYLGSGQATSGQAARDLGSVPIETR